MAKDLLTEVKELKHYRLFMDNPCYDELFFCGVITKQQAEDLLKELSTCNTTPESCCFGKIKALILTKSEICVNLASKQSDKYIYDRPAGQLKIYFDHYKCKCKTGSCIWNIKHGKCKDETVRNTIGKILFTKAYSKSK